VTVHREKIIVKRQGGMSRGEPRLLRSDKTANDFGLSYII